MAVEFQAAPSLQPAHLAIAAHETPGAAVTNAWFASLHGLPVVPHSSRRRPFRFSNHALVTSLHGAKPPQERRASVCGLAAGAALRLRFAKRSSPSSAPLAPLAERRPKPSQTT